MKGVRRFALSFSVILFAMPTFVHAQAMISEIMYDAKGADTGQEWFELYNAGTVSIDLSKWKVNDGSNHTFNAPPKNGGTGSLIFAPQTFLIVAGDAAAFRAAHPTVSDSIIDTTVNLSNTGGTISLLNASGTVMESVQYASYMGASGNGDSLQRLQLVQHASFQSGPPTPGAAPPTKLTATPPPAPKVAATRASKTKTFQAPTKKVTTKNIRLGSEDSIATDTSDVAQITDPEAQTASATSVFSAGYLWWIGAFVLAGVASAGMIAANRFKKNEWDIVEEIEE